MKDSRGVLMFAHNNDEIDYIRIACANALMVKTNLGVPVALLTDESSHRWAISSMGEEFLTECFDHIIVSTRDYVYQQNNPRVYKDTAHTVKSLQFYNCNHWMAYDVSPFEETLFIDADYFIMSDALANCWGSNNDVMVNHNIVNVSGMVPMAAKHIDVFGIKQYWATVIYFKKTETARHLFTLVKHVFDNYEFYCQLYLIHGVMFRNDYAVSIAVHMLNGFTNTNVGITELPIGGMLMSFDTDDVLGINGINDITLFVAKPKSLSEFTLLRLKDTDIHIINKWAARRISDDIIKLYRSKSNVEII